MKLQAVAIALAAIWITADARATTINVIGYDNSFGMQLTVNVNGHDESIWAGPLKTQVDSSQIVEAFCLDFFTSIGYQSYVVQGSMPGPSFFDTASRLYSEFISDMNSASGNAANLYGAAMQLALWEVTIDNLAATPSLENSALTTGNFKESTTSPWGSQLEATVEKYLQGAFTAPAASNTVIYTGVGQDIQALITGGKPPSVPEPATWTMIGGALLGLGLIRRRKA